MKLKSLLFITVFLALLTTGIFLLRQEDQQSPVEDPLVGTHLLKSEVLERIQRVDISNEAGTVKIRQNAPDSWVVASYHDLPLDTPKLQRLIRQLNESRLKRKLTSRPERLQSLELGQESITLMDKAGDPLLSFLLGKSLPQGGRAIAFDKAGPAYQAELNGYIDFTSSNWVDKELVHIVPGEVVGMQFFLADGSNWAVRRDNIESDFISTIPGDLRIPDQDALQNILQRYSSIRFTQAIPSEAAPEHVSEAMENARHMRITLESGEAINIFLAQWQTPQNPSETDENQAPSPSSTYLKILSSQADKPINSWMNQLVFEASSYLYDGLPVQLQDVAKVPEKPVAMDETVEEPTDEAIEKVVQTTNDSETVTNDVEGAAAADTTTDPQAEDQPETTPKPQD